MFLLKPGRRIDIDHSFQDLGVRTDSNGCVDIRIMLLPLVDGCGWYACCVVDEVHKGQVGGLSEFEVHKVQECQSITELVVRGCPVLRWIDAKVSSDSFKGIPN